MAKTMTVTFSKDGENWADADAAFTAISNTDTGAFTDNKPKELIDADIAAGKATRERTLVNATTLKIVTVWANDSDFDTFLTEKDKLFSGSRSTQNSFAYTMTVE